MHFAQTHLKVYLKRLVYLDGDNVSAIQWLHILCTDSQLPCLVDLPGLVERTERAVDSGDTRRWRAQGCVHHHVLTQTCSVSEVQHIMQVIFYSALVIFRYFTCYSVSSKFNYKICRFVNIFFIISVVLPKVLFLIFSVFD